MSKLKTHSPKTFSEFLNIVLKKQVDSKNPLWFRGCGRSSHNLIPTLYRHKKTKDINKLIELEYQLMTRFRQRSVPFHNKNLDNDWDSLFFMQHYGIPTRFLDWTESPFIAFYFAMMSAENINSNGKGNTFKEAAAVWMFDPVNWNRHSLRHEKFDQGILSTIDEQIRGYRPTSKKGIMNDLPVAIFGTHNSSRIVAQRGTFVIFGENQNPMEELFVSESFPRNSLVKIVLNKSYLRKMKEQILNNGITESVVFPDLEGLAKEIRRTFEFEV